MLSLEQYIIVFMLRKILEIIMMMAILMITILFKIPVNVKISSDLTVSCSESAVSQSSASSFLTTTNFNYIHKSTVWWHYMSPV